MLGKKRWWTLWWRQRQRNSQALCGRLSRDEIREITTAEGDVDLVNIRWRSPGVHFPSMEWSWTLIRIYLFILFLFFALDENKMSLPIIMGGCNSIGDDTFSPIDMEFYCRWDREHSADGDRTFPIRDRWRSIDSIFLPVWGSSTEFHFWKCYENCSILGHHGNMFMWLSWEG